MREDSENDGFIDNVLTFATNFIGQEFNGRFDFSKICEFLIWDFVKFSPWNNIILRMVESELKWPSGAHTITSR